jgi:hypothetical protein
MAGHCDNEYQDPMSLGSLVAARGVWIALVSTGEQARFHRLGFILACPTEFIAGRLAAFLHATTDASAAAVSRRGSMSPCDAWLVRGSTPNRVQSLEYLEHLFTSVRRAAKEHDSELVALHLHPRAA